MNKEIKSYTHVALVLDASGSMDVLRETTISTLKEFFASLASSEDRVVVDLWQFNDRVCHLLEGVDLETGTCEALEGYRTGGRTALHDAVCIGIDALGAKFAAMREEERPDAVVFAILTDGFENASRRFSKRDVRERIAHQTEKYAWDFRFLASRPSLEEVVKAGADIGILHEEKCAMMEASEEGVRCCCKRMSRDIQDDVIRSARKRRAQKGRTIVE